MITEMDDLKASWKILNKQLEQTEIVNRRIIKEMILNRTKSAHSKILKWEWKSCMIGGAALIFLLLLPQRTNTAPHMIALLIVSFALLWTLVKLAFFMNRIDPSKNTLIEMRQWLLKYQKIQRIEYFLFVPIGVITLAVFFLIQQHYNRINMLVADGAIILFGILFVVLWNKYIYKPTINQMDESLKDLNEFEEINEK